MVYGELANGLTPLSVDIQKRLISFLSKLIVNHDYNKLSSEIYNIVYELHSAKVIKSKWVDNLKELLCSLVFFSGIWYNQCFLNSKWLVKASKQKLKDQCIQKWITNLEMTSDSNNYLKQNLKRVNIY